VDLRIGFAGNAEAFMISAWALTCRSQVRLFILQIATESIGPSSAHMGILAASGCVKDRWGTPVFLFMSNKQQVK
jgi:hypothetical protein